MKLFLYDTAETKFENRGFGAIQGVLTASVQEEINGLFDLSFTCTYDSPTVKELQEGMIVRAKMPTGSQAFRIDNITKEMEEIRVHASHVFYDLAHNMIESTRITNQSGASALKQLLDNCAAPHPFTQGVSDATGPVSSWLVRKNPVEALMGDADNALLKRGSGELLRDNFTLSWRQHLGSDRGVKIKYRKNLTGLSFEEDYTAITTRIMPVGFDGLLLPEKYVDSPRIKDYHGVRIKKIRYEKVISKQLSPEQEGAKEHEVALEMLRASAKKEFADGADLPKVQAEVNFIDLSQTKEYADYVQLEKILLGDTVTVTHHPSGLDFRQRVTGYEWDPIGERYVQIHLGDIESVFTASLSRGDIALQKVEELESSVWQHAVDAATDLINKGYGGYVRIYPDRILIMDRENEKTAERVWQWNKNGLGLSKTGINGPYEYAWTVEGKLNTAFLAANSINVNHLSADVGQNLDIASNLAIREVERTTKAEVNTQAEITRSEIAKADYADKAYLDGVLDDIEQARLAEMTRRMDDLRKELRGYTQQEIYERVQDFEQTLQELEKYLYYDKSTGVLTLGIKGVRDFLQMSNYGIKLLEGNKVRAEMTKENMDIHYTKTKRLQMTDKPIDGRSIFEWSTRVVDGVDHLTLYYIGGGNNA